MINKERLVNQFMELVRIDSVSYKEAGVRDYLRSRLETLGLEVTEDHAAASVGGESGNLVANLPGKDLTSPIILLGAHMDTVEPGSGIKPQLKEDRIVSDGSTILAADDKAGIAALLELIQVLIENQLPHPPLQFLFSVGEEQGLQGAKALDMSLIRADFGYVLDSDGPAGEIVIQGPSQKQIEWNIIGKAAHAGMNPEDGINAIQAAARGLAAIPCGRIDEETTCNIGLISGGTARNIVAEKCLVKGEARSLNQQKLENLTRTMVEDFERAVSEYGARCEVSVTPLYSAFQLPEEAPVVQVAAAAARAMEREPRLVKSGGGSDANILNNRGLPVANLGVGMKQPHTTAEYILVSDLVDTAQWLLNIVREAGGKK